MDICSEPHLNNVSAMVSTLQSQARSVTWLTWLRKLPRRGTGRRQPQVFAFRPAVALYGVGILMFLFYGFLCFSPMNLPFGECNWEEPYCFPAENRVSVEGLGIPGSVVGAPV